MAIVRRHIWVSGIVQGVFFRAHTRDVARSNKLTGWVRNLWDGRVEIVAEGEEASVQRLIDWCHKGPRLSRVDRVDVEEEEPLSEFEDFRVTY